GQALRQRARQRVTATARRKRHDQAHEAVWEALRMRGPREPRQQGRRSEVQEHTARYVRAHGQPPTASTNDSRLFTVSTSKPAAFLKVFALASSCSCGS